MQEDKDGSYPLYATVQWGIIFSELNGSRTGALIGPRLNPTLAHFKANERFTGIVFHGGTSLNGVGKSELLNKIEPIQMVGYDEFLIQEKRFRIPSYDDFDLLIQDLINNDVMSTAPIVAVSHRDKQRKIKRYTGLSPKQIEQATRVEHAVDLLSRHTKLSAVASQAGFSDQAHMTRDFRKFAGLTPSEIVAYFNNSPNP